MKQCTFVQVTQGTDNQQALANAKGRAACGCTKCKTFQRFDTDWMAVAFFGGHRLNP